MDDRIWAKMLLSSFLSYFWFGTSQSLPHIFCVRCWMSLPSLVSDFLYLWSTPFHCRILSSHYIGQMRRTTQNDYDEHMNCFKKLKREKSDVADHLWEKMHFTNKVKLRLVKKVMSPLDLDIWEAIFIPKSSRTGLMNKGGRNITSNMIFTVRHPSEICRWRMRLGNGMSLIEIRSWTVDGSISWELSSFIQSLSFSISLANEKKQY